MRVLLFNTAMVALVAGMASAQDVVGDDPITLEPITVTGLRVPTSIDQTGRSVSIITSEEIEGRQQRFLLDTLQSVPGLQTTRSGTFGGLSTVSIRGLPSDQTLVVQDGVVVNNPAFFGNSFDFANFDTADISRVEVLRGAQSTLYGSNAIGGVINVVTEDGRDGFGASAFVEGGSFETFRGSASLRGGTERLSGRVTVAGVTTGGFSAADEADGNTEDDGFNNFTVSSKVRAKPIDSLTFEAVARYSDSANEFDGFDLATFAFGDADETGDTNELTIAGFLTHSAFDDRVQNRFAITHFDSDIVNLSSGVPSFIADGTRTSYEYQGTFRPIDGLDIVAGFEFEEESSGGAEGFGPDAEAETTSLFALAQYSPVSVFTVNGGVRVDNNTLAGSETTFSVSGVLTVPGTGLAIRGSYAEGFQAPTTGELDFNLSQLDAFDFGPDVDLLIAPEFSTGWDIGIDQTLFEGRVKLQATYFNQSVDDLITFEFVPGAPSFGIFTNLEVFDTEGVEVSARVEILPNLGFTGSYTYVDATNVTTFTVAANQPDNRFTAEIDYRPTKKLALSAAITFNGEEISAGQTLDGFTLLTLRGAYQLTEHVELFVRVENANNADFQDIFGFGTAPASAFGGLRATF